MTAEIAVYNKTAVALAADSAVTITDGNGNNSKIYNGAEKLFALTKYHPVGIMVYGTGSLCGVPWELIIKQYRKVLGKRAFDTLDAYAEDFFDYLSGNEHLIPRDLREAYLNSIWRSAFYNLVEAVEAKVVEVTDETGESPTLDDTYVIFESTCDELIDTYEVTEESYLKGFTKEVEKEVHNDSLKFVIELIQQDYDEQIEFPEQLVEKISYLISLITVKKNEFGENTGVVFAGYGDKEYFPVVLAFNIRGFYKEKLRLLENTRKSSVAGQSYIQAYAQEDEVTAFMTGINPKLDLHIKNTYQSMFFSMMSECQRLIESALNDVDEIERLKGELQDFANSKWDSSQEKLMQVVVEEHMNKVLHMVEFLPKDELGYMAESLVNMTAFKRKVSNESETVGGPIDVAIISKGDGFVWTKRKHYFDKELNNHYFSNFLKGTANE